MKSNTAIFALMILTLTFFTSCKKEVDNNTDSGTSPTGTLTFHMHTNIGDTEVEDYGTLYTTTDGRSISLNIAQMYISDIQLVKLDGSVYNVPNKNVLKVLEEESMIIGNVPVGNYKSVRFKVGLSSATNALDPTTPSDSAILNKPEMWFSNPVQPNGYVFMNVEGTIDTTVAMNGTPVAFSYKVGTNANYVQVEMPDQNFTVLAGGSAFVHMLADYSKLFSGFDLTNSGNLTMNTVSANGSALGTTIKNNIPLMFRYE